MAENEVAVVTGAGGGIGKATALRLARAGMAIAAVDLNRDAAEQTASDIVASSGRCIAITCDVSDFESVQQAADKVLNEIGCPTVLVNNAGISIRRPLLELPLADWQRIIAVNLTSMFICTQIVARQMVLHKVRGRIVNMASTSAVQVTRPGLAAYAASKGGVRMFTRSAAFELAPHGIRVNAVGPGVVETNINRAMLTGEVREAYLARIPLGHMGQPEDVADVVAFLSSDESRHMTGTTLFVDGGAMLGGTGVQGVWKA